MNNKSNNIVAWIAVLPLVILIFFFCPDGLSIELKNCYYNICIQIVFIYLIWMFILSKTRIDLLEPIVLVSVIHVLLFEVTPIVCLLTDRIMFFGTYVWGGCIDGTYISTLGYVILIIFYFSKSYVLNDTDIPTVDSFRINNKEKCLLFNYCVWFVSFVCNFIVVLGYGLNLRYLLTGGNAVLESEVSTKSSYGFLVIIAYAMIPSFLYIFELSKNKFVKIVLFYLMFMSYYVRGFRFIMIAVLMSPVVYYFLKKKKRPNLLFVGTILVLLAIFSGYMQFARSSIRAGAGGSIDMNTVFNFENITDMLVDNFEIVKTYYAIVENVPSKVSFFYGAEIFLYTAVLLVPRFIWPGKPQPPIYSVVSQVVNSYSRDAGTSFPYIGEYYFEFGVVGVVFFMAILGNMLKFLKRYMYRCDCHNYIIYSCVFPLLLQVLIRGYTPTNFYMILAVLIPPIISKKVICK